MCAVIDVVRPYQLLALSNHILLMCYHQHLHLPLCRESSQQLAQQPHLIHIKRSVDFVSQHDGAWLDGREKPSLRTPNWSPGRKRAGRALAGLRRAGGRASTAFRRACTTESREQTSGYAEDDALRVGGGVVLRVFDVAIALSEGVAMGFDRVEWIWSEWSREREHLGFGWSTRSHRAAAQNAALRVISLRSSANSLKRNLLRSATDR